MSFNDYQGGLGALEKIQYGGNVFVKVYNDSTAVSNGAIKVLGFKVTSGAIVPVMVAPATEITGANWVGVVNNSIRGKATIPADEWGFLQIGGYCDARVDGTDNVAAGAQLEVLTTGTAFIVSGGAASAVLKAETVAIAMEAYITDAVALKKVFLIGKQSAIQAT